MSRSEIPVIDLFAGPGGLCEGFSSIVDKNGARRFAVKVSIEKDPVAQRTLMLRALFRKFPKGKAPQAYYDYICGAMKREQFLAHPDIKDAAEEAAKEARLAELGKTPHEEIDGWIREALGESREWVLIGGPPCQAYSLAGRAKMRGKDPKAFEADKRHFLYTEYLRIIQEFEPAVFVMENVKGMLNSKHGGSHIFDRILADLREPKEGLSYEVRSLVVAGKELEPKDYVIEAEDFGIPQSRHRVILFGIRSDVAEATTALQAHPRWFLMKKSNAKVPVNAAIAGLPALRSKLSKEPDSHEAWLKALRDAPLGLKMWRSPVRMKIETMMAGSTKKAMAYTSFGGPYIPMNAMKTDDMPAELRKWLLDPRLGGVLQHESRSHMRSDLHRYQFASCFTKIAGYSPKLRIYPPRLLPNHGNLKQDGEDGGEGGEEMSIPFSDRFRVQVGWEPSTTVVAHIKKDGHYYIHPDPSQCRSLTVREAARLQTFPDNYFFEGNRTEQYGQIGNAVPPLLANKIAKAVYKFLMSSGCLLRE
jgi:DNA (cytosine-5)-methyltransferase 1